jgi:hypothetical protein
MGRRSEILLGTIGGADVIDALVALLTNDGDEIYLARGIRPDASLAGHSKRACKKRCAPCDLDPGTGLADAAQRS